MPAFLVLDDVSCNEKTHSLSWFHYSLSKSNFTSYYKPTIGYLAIVQSGWFLVISCRNALLTHHIKIGLGFSASALKKSSKIKVAEH